MIFLHGWGGNYINFESSSLALSKQFTCVNVSFFDTLEACPLTLDDYVSFIADIACKLRQSGIKEITAVGHSFGGRVAIRLSSRAIVDKIVLIDSAGLKPKVRLKHILLRCKYKLLKLMRLNTSACGSSDYRQLQGARRGTFNNIVREYQDGELSTINVPCWIFWGSHDKDTPLYMAKRLRRGIKGSGLFIVKGGGHYSYLDDYQSFLSGLSCFIKS